MSFSFGLTLAASFITGMPAEARLLVSLPVSVFVGGGTPAGAARAAAAALSAGASALISFGLAGGLDPALAPGAVLRPAGVHWQGQVFTTDAALVAVLGGVTCTSMLAAYGAIASAADKQAAHARSGAAGVDLESGAVAELAARHGVPFAVVRAVADSAVEDLPEAALAALDQAGKINILRVAHSVVRKPTQVPALLALAAHAGAARKTLSKEVAGILARNALDAWL